MSACSTQSQPKLLVCAKTDRMTPTRLEGALLAACSPRTISELLPLLLYFDQTLIFHRSHDVISGAFTGNLSTIAHLVPMATIPLWALNHEHLQELYKDEEVKAFAEKHRELLLTSYRHIFGMLTDDHRMIFGNPEHEEIAAANMACCLLHVLKQKVSSFNPFVTDEMSASQA
jgi:hypothetical protein